MKKKMYSFYIFITVLGVLALPLEKIPGLEAAIPVIDAANINQQNLTYLQTLQTVVNTAQQITLQLKELQPLPAGTIDNFKSILNGEVDIIQKSLTNTTGFLNPQKDLDSVWNSNFKSAGTVDATNFTSSTAGAVNSTTISALDKANYDSFSVVRDAINNLDQTKSNLNNLMILNDSAEGQKQAGQINNMLLAEQAKLLQQQNTIRAAEATARISYYQRLNQIDALADAQGRQAANSILNMETNTSSPAGGN